MYVVRDILLNKKRFQPVSTWVDTPETTLKGSSCNRTISKGFFQRIFMFRKNPMDFMRGTKNPEDLQRALGLQKEPLWTFSSKSVVAVLGT
jgi:hypothetical protein